MRDVHRFYATARIVGVIIVALCGCAAAAAALGAGHGQSVNIFWVVISLLGIQTVLLAGWLAAVAWPRPPAFAGAVTGWLRRAARWVFRGRGAHRAVIEAAAGFALRPQVVRWGCSTASHQLWLAFNVGCFTALLVLLSARSYSFHWETTILSAGAYEQLTDALAAGPRRLGFATPTTEQVAATQHAREGLPKPGAQQAWSGFLLGSLVTYALIPRAGLLVLSVVLAWRAMRRQRLELDDPRWAAIVARLAPTSRSLGVIERASDPLPGPPTQAVDSPVSTGESHGSIAILGWELNFDGQWPPVIEGVRWLDLGCMDDRRALQQAVRRAPAGTPRQPLVVVCSLTTTPDRGVASMLSEIGSRHSASLCLLLTGGEALRRRTDAAGVERRVQDWRSLAAQCGIGTERILEVDLEHMTATSAGRLSRMLGASAGEVAGPGQLARSFRLIAKAGERGVESLDDAACRALFHDIRALYEGRGLADWWPGDGVRVEPSLLKDRLAQRAASVASLLPGRLRADSRWVLAGALAGALGCVAAAGVFAPAAIAALPMWSAVGAAVAAVARVSGASGVRAVTTALDGGDLAPWRDRIRAATLYSMLLELQGRAEAAIARVLDRAVGDHELDQPSAPAACTAWLNRVRDRFDRGLHDESRS